MNAAWLAAGALGAFAIALRLYSRLLDRRIFQLDAQRPTPSHTLKDDVDFCPTRPAILFGHHFASICGLGPILGPALAAVWGWAPAFLWIVLGVIFIGAAHDFGSLVLSTRYQGRSIGDLTHDLIGPRARLLFLIIIFFLIALAMGIFTSVIATLFDAQHYPEAVLPSIFLIAIAVVIGQLVHRRQVALGSATAAGFVLMLGSLWLGLVFPVVAPRMLWIVLLLGYAFVASFLPVWMLLQPRDYLNAFLLYLGIGLMYLGLFVLRPAIAAPAFNHHPADLPPLFPFLFITVACGAVSGFHSLVCSGTTSKQLDREPHARSIGYGGMLAEGAMAVIVLLACVAGAAATTADWHARYTGWTAAGGLGASLRVFIDGAAHFIAQLGVSHAVATVFISVVVVGFALTTLDSATRLLRYNIEELGRTLRVPAVTNRYTASGLAVAAIGYFALMPWGKSLWQLFGTTNQLLAALALLAITAYAYQRRRPTVFYALPMLFMFTTTTSAMVIKLGEFWSSSRGQLFVVSLLILALTGWLVFEAVVGFMKSHRAMARRRSGG